jgi:hypothetical protein
MDLTKYQNINQQVVVSGHNIVPYILNISQWIQNSGVQIMPYPTVILSSSQEYANDPFGKTAYYNPEEKSVTLFVAGRHIKDVLRSFSHELVHHNQNLSGKFDASHIQSLSDPRYAENDKHLLEMEKDAYLRGNILFRFWEDSIK